MWQNPILINPTNQDPKDIFAAYCQELGLYFSEHGFKASKTKIERHHGDIVESINFWSSKTNIRNESVHLETLAYVKSRKLKKWIKENGIGRNEFIYKLKDNYPKHTNLFSHSYQDFLQLTSEIESSIIPRLYLFSNSVPNVEHIIESTQFDNGIIHDNFMAYICMSRPDLIDRALTKYKHQLREDKRLEIEEFRLKCK